MKESRYTPWQKFKAAAALFILFGGCFFVMALATITMGGGDTHITAGNVALVNISDNEFNAFNDWDLFSGNWFKKCSTNGYNSANESDCSGGEGRQPLIIEIGGD